MILILSEESDQSTNDVIDWLAYYKKDFVRVNYEDFITKIYLDKKSLVLYFKDKPLDFDKITSFWNRRGIFNYEKLAKLGNIPSYQAKHLLNEWKCIENYIHFKLRQKKGIINPSSNINKLIALDVAQQAGLLVPDYIITDFKCNAFENNIVKSIGEAFDDFDGKNVSTFYTEELESINYDSFFATLIQQKITPKYEARSIFIKDKCWSMAVHNPQKEVDYRKNYDNLRYSPLEIPIAIKRKVIKLMKALNLQYGAVDFIVDSKSKYYFLEINPFGQFGMVSDPCNYFIEKEIAKIL